VSLGDRTKTRLNPGVGGDAMDEVVTRVDLGEDLKAPVVVQAYRDGASAALLDPYPSKRFDIQAAVIYVGHATRGSAPGAAVWKIKKVALDGSGSPTSTTWTAATAVWDNHTTESYS